jgi:hypothetical protein
LFAKGSYSVLSTQSSALFERRKGGENQAREEFREAEEALRQA